MRIPCSSFFSFLGMIALPIDVEFEMEPTYQWWGSLHGLGHHLGSQSCDSLFTVPISTFQEFAQDKFPEEYQKRCEIVKEGNVGWFFWSRSMDEGHKLHSDSATQTTGMALKPIHSSAASSC
jgi:hypothetical protein